MTSYSEHIHVAVAALRDSAGRLLIARRHPDSHQGGLWEFPGGKLEQDETVYDALVRELNEELGISVLEARPLIRIPYDYADRRVLLDVWLVTEYKGEAAGCEGQEVEWVNLGDMSHYKMPPANLTIISALNLPDSYLITPEPGYTDIQWEAFLRQLEIGLSRGIELVQFRAKLLDIGRYVELFSAVLALCHTYSCRVLCNTVEIVHPDIAYADGIHMPSAMLMQQKKRFIGTDKLLAASCHNLAEIRHANAIGCDFIVLSPVKQTVSHPDCEPLGWEGFSELCDESAIPVYALGGMTQYDKSDVWCKGGQGISGIRTFWYE